MKSTACNAAYSAKSYPTALFRKSYLFLSPIFLASILLSPTIAHTIKPFTVVGTINTGVNPNGLAITPNGHFAYVTNNNNYGIEPDQASVSVLNLKTNTLQTTIHDASFVEPYRVAINPAGTKAYVCNSSVETVTIIDIATNTVIGVINGFDGPSGIVINSHGTTAYVNNYGVVSAQGNTVSVVNLHTNTVVETLVLGALGTAPAAIAITPDDKYVYTVNYANSDNALGYGTVSVIRTSDNALFGPLALGLSGPYAISITPDGKYAYVTNFGSNNFSPIGSTMSVLDLTHKTAPTVAATIDLAIQPAGINISPDGRFVCATNYNVLYAGANFTNLTPGQGTVNIIDTDTNTVLPPTIAVGQGPDGVAISPNGKFAYITNYISNTVTVIALPTCKIIAQGDKIQNRYLTQIDLINKLTWSASGTSLPVSFQIYRDSQLTDLATTIVTNKSSEPFVFLDHNRKPNTTYSYYIVGTNEAGTSSDPVEIIIS